MSADDKTGIAAELDGVIARLTNLAERLAEARRRADDDPEAARATFDAILKDLRRLAECYGG